MKEKIYTIPLSEAYQTDCECPFCKIEEKLETEAVDYSLGASMMEPDARIISNDKGYCRRHFAMMKEKSEALSLALIPDTHLKETIEKLLNAADSGKAKKKLFAKSSEEDAVLNVIENVDSSCVICEKIKTTLEKFAEVFWYLYKKESDFKEKVLSSKGFCLPHFKLLLEKMGRDTHGAREEIIELEIKNLKRINDEVNKFTKKFDYRFAKEPWESAKDAPERAIKKLSKF